MFLLLFLCFVGVVGVVYLVGWFYFVLFCFYFVPICFLKIKKNRKQIWNSGEVGGIWEEMREGNSDQNILYENKIHFKIKKERKSTWY